MKNIRSTPTKTGFAFQFNTFIIHFLIIYHLLTLMTSTIIILVNSISSLKYVFTTSTPSPLHFHCFCITRKYVFCSVKHVWDFHHDTTISIPWISPIHYYQSTIPPEGFDNPSHYSLLPLSPPIEPEP